MRNELARRNGAQATCPVITAIYFKIVLESRSTTPVRGRLRAGGLGHQPGRQQCRALCGRYRAGRDVATGIDPLGRLDQNLLSADRGNPRITPGGWEQRTGQRLRFVCRRGRPSLLVAETRLNSKGRAVVSKSKTGRGLATVPIFILVPQVKLPKRLNLEGPAREAEARLPGLIVANWRDAQYPTSR